MASLNRTRAKLRLYIVWVYVKSVFYSLKSFLKRNHDTDRFIYK